MIILNIGLMWIFYNLLISNLHYISKTKGKFLGCGLVGFSGPDKCDSEKIKLLLLWNSLSRGEDATGIYSPLNGLKTSLLKGSDFVISKDEVHSIIPDNIVIGHVRAATVGQNTIKNAHPFMRGNCVLAHNGTLKNHYALLEKYGLSFADYNVDSDMICGIMNKTKDARVLSEIDGAAAMLIADTKIPDTLYVFKKGVTTGNTERTLFRGNIGANMYISSIAEALTFIGCINVKSFKDNSLYTISRGSVIGNVKKIKNNPYSRPTVLHKNFRVDTSLKNCHAHGSWLRAAESCEFTVGKTTTFSIEKDKYYLCVNVTCNERLTILEPNSKNSYGIETKYLVLDDILKKDDYVICIQDVIHENSNYMNGSSTVKLHSKGDILIVDMVYPDMDVSLRKPLGHTVAGRYILKKNVRKLTSEELEQYNNDCIESAYLMQPAPNNQLNMLEMIEGEDVKISDIVLNNNPALDNEELQEVDSEDYYNHQVNDEVTQGYFAAMDEGLEDILGNVFVLSKEEIANKLTTLIELNTSSAIDCFPVEEEIKE